MAIEYVRGLFRGWSLVNLDRIENRHGQLNELNVDADRKVPFIMPNILGNCKRCENEQDEGQKHSHGITSKSDNPIIPSRIIGRIDGRTSHNFFH